MFFPTLGAQIAQILPDKVRDKLGLHQSQGPVVAGASSNSNSEASKDQYAKSQPGAALNPTANPTALPDGSLAMAKPPNPNQGSQSKAPEATNAVTGAQTSPNNPSPTEPAPTKPSEKSAGESTTQQPSEASPEAPTEQPTPTPSLTGNAAPETNTPPAPREPLKPLTVEQLFNKRMGKSIDSKKPKFSLTPEEISYNPMRKEQECLGRMVKALPWNDGDSLNPFHIGSCNTFEKQD